MEEDWDNDIVDVLCAPDTEPEWVVKDLMVQGSFITLCGESGAGKSIVSYHIAMSIAAGLPVLGLLKAGEPKRVVYFDNENSGPDRTKYLKQVWLGLKATNKGKTPDLGLMQENFWVIPTGHKYALGNDDWTEKLAIVMEGLHPDAAFFDTAAACFNIEEENSNSEAAKVIREIKRQMAMVDPPASPWVIKHAKTRTEKGQIRTVRGAKIWKDQSDSLLFFIKASIGRPRKDGLVLTRMVPDKRRAWGLPRSLYITPSWTNPERSGLKLDGSYSADKAHKEAEKEDE